MKIILNGKEVELENSKTIAELILEVNVKSQLFAVEKNLEIINKEDYNTSKINKGDEIEIVSFTGGG